MPSSPTLIARIIANGKQAQFLTPLLYEDGSDGKPRGQSSSRDITIGNNASHSQPGVGYLGRSRI
jgi:hypothetical protein